MVASPRGFAVSSVGAMRTGAGGPNVRRVSTDEHAHTTGGPDDPRSGPSAARPRVGVVLAAGRSERLSMLTKGRSKALVQLGGVSLGERAVRTLLNAGCEKGGVGVG